MGHTLNTQTLIKTDEQKKGFKYISNFVLGRSHSRAAPHACGPQAAGLDTLARVPWEMPGLSRKSVSTKSMGQVRDPREAMFTCAPVRAQVYTCHEPH